MSFYPNNPNNPNPPPKRIGIRQSLNLAIPDDEQQPDYGYDLYQNAIDGGATSYSDGIARGLEGLAGGLISRFNPDSANGTRRRRRSLRSNQTDEDDPYTNFDPAGDLYKQGLTAPASSYSDGIAKGLESLAGGILKRYSTSA